MWTSDVGYYLSSVKHNYLVVIIYYEIYEFYLIKLYISHKIVLT